MKQDIVTETINRINLEEQLLLEMAFIDKKDYNLPVGIWVDEAGKDRNVKHNEPRVKIVNNYNNDKNDLLPITIAKNPKEKGGKCKLSTSDLNKIKDFIINNYDILMARWNQEITTKEMFKQLDDNN